jgi:hypothetical protein
MKMENEKHYKIVEDILHGIPLKLRLEVSIEMWLQSHLVDIGVIPNGYWSDVKERKYGKLFRKPSKKLTEWIMRDIKEWEKDGSPK